MTDDLWCLGVSHCLSVVSVVQCKGYNVRPASFCICIQ